MLAHQPMECQPSRIVVLVAMYQRPSPSVSANFRAAPRMTAQIRMVPNSVPAVSEETMSPAPTPVAATTRPGPMSLSRFPQLDGASSAAASPVGLSVTSDMGSPSRIPFPWVHYTTDPARAQTAPVGGPRDLPPSPALSVSGRTSETATERSRAGRDLQHPDQRDRRPGPARSNRARASPILGAVAGALGEGAAVLAGVAAAGAHAVLVDPYQLRPANGDYVVLARPRRRAPSP